MPDDRPRISIADGMIAVAVAAVAVAFAVIRGMHMLDAAPQDVSDAIKLGIAILGIFLASTSLAYLAIRLRPPRPPIRRLARRPGLAACGAASAATGFVAVLAARSLIGDPGSADGRVLGLLVAFCGGFAVLGSWLTLATACLWRRPAPGGIERLGWLIGWAWLADLATLSIQLLVGF